MFTDVSSFETNLRFRRDASFFLCGETSRFIYKLCSRCYTPDTAPLENAWFLLLKFHTSEATFMAGGEFLLRLKLTNRVTTSSKTSAEGIHFGTKTERAAIQKTATTVKTKFIDEGLQFIQYLINSVLRQTGLSSNIIKGLAAFDPFIMFKRPTEVALRHFDLLYRTFCLRSWVTKAIESTCRDQYTVLLDQLRICYDPDYDLSNSSPDLIDFLLGLEFLQSRDHLFYIFKLCCLCATTPRPDYPDVVAGKISTVGRHSRFTDVILPCQSYMASVSGSSTLCSEDSNLATFSLLSASFGQSAFSPIHDPWNYVDNFGRSKIYKSLSSSYRAVLAVPEKVLARSELDDSVADESALKPPSCNKRRRLEKSRSRSSTSSVVGESAPGTSNS